MSSTLTRLATSALPRGFTRQTHILRPGHPVPYQASTWAGALVLITTGQLELVLRDGSGAVFNQHSILTLDGLNLSALRSVGPAPTVLITITRSGDERADQGPRSGFPDTVSPALTQRKA